MKKIKIFSAELNKEVEGSEAEMYVNFYLVFSKNFGFDFLVDSPNMCCSHRNPIKAWIPYPERKPEEYKDVLIDIKEGEKHTFYVTHLVDVNYWVTLGRDVNVVAWMTLPDSYEESEGEE